MNVGKIHIAGSISTGFGIQTTLQDGQELKLILTAAHGVLDPLMHIHFEQTIDAMQGHIEPGEPEKDYNTGQLYYTDTDILMFDRMNKVCELELLGYEMLMFPEHGNSIDFALLRIVEGSADPAFKLDYFPLMQEPYTGRSKVSGFPQGVLMDDTLHIYDPQTANAQSNQRQTFIKRLITPIGKGASGSPLVYKGRVAGLCVAKFYDETLYDTSNGNIAHGKAARIILRDYAKKTGQWVQGIATPAREVVAYLEQFVGVDVQNMRPIDTSKFSGDDTLLEEEDVAPMGFKGKGAHKTPSLRRMKISPLIELL